MSSNRTIHHFDMPEQYHSWAKQVGFVELTAQEELQAGKRAKQDPLRLMFELVKASLVEVDGAKVSIANQSADQKIDTCPAQARSLLMAAYNSIHQPDEDEQQTFLKSRRTRT